MSCSKTLRAANHFSHASLCSKEICFSKKVLGYHHLKGAGCYKSAHRVDIRETTGLLKILFHCFYELELCEASCIVEKIFLGSKHGVPRDSQNHPAPPSLKSQGPDVKASVDETLDSSLHLVFPGFFNGSPKIFGVTNIWLGCRPGNQKNSMWPT